MLRLSVLIKLTNNWSKKILFIFIFLVTACNSQDDKITSPGNYSTNQLMIQVEQEGFYRLPLESLNETGAALESLDTENLRLSQAGTSVPYHISNDSLIFYGQAPDDRYLATRPYLLEFGMTGESIVETTLLHRAIPVLEQLPLVKRLEENNIYNPKAINTDDDDYWVWKTINPQEKLPLSVTLPAVGDGSAMIRVNLWGVTYDSQVENDHDLDVTLNGQNVGAIRWDGATFYDYSLQIAPGSLVSGENTFILDNEASGAAYVDIMQLNWLEMTYMAPPVATDDQLEFQGVDGHVTLSGFSGRPAIFDISNPDAPLLLTGWEFSGDQAAFGVSEDIHIAAIGPNGYLYPDSIQPVRQGILRKPDNQADLLIVTTDELAPALSPLIEAREAQGLRVALVPVPEIYDEFGFGKASPESIQGFVSYAYNNWKTPSPAYLLLVGDATFDYRNYLGTAPKNMIPSLMVPVMYSGETVSDSRLADVDGDMQPDLAVGRWPVSEKSDVEDLVKRTLAYEQGMADDTALFATDGSEARFASLATSLWTESNFPETQIKLLDGPQASELTDRWNEGAWLTTYIGHGSVQLWGKNNVFNPEAVKDLEATTPPIVLQLTCLTGLFAHPELTSLSETMLVHKQGPVLIIAATSLTLSNDQEPLALAFLQSLQDPAIVRIGDAFQRAKLALDIENSNGLREISDTFVLLGDPTAMIVRPD